MKNRIGHIGLLRLLERIGLLGLLALLAPMALIGCSEGQHDPEEGTVSIGFRANLAEDEGGDGSRAAGDGELTTVLLKDKGFGVYCWYTKNRDILFTDDSKGTTPEAHISTYTDEDGYMLMRNQKVEWNSSTGKWGYSPVKYWPLDPDDKLTFRAYAPYTTYLMTDNTGMPKLPVVVAADDYHNGTQHDPLWGTGRLVQGETDPTPGEYFPKPEPDDANPEETYLRYGSPYNNITYKMSGDWRDKPTAHDPADTRDGIIDWFFHHGMSKLMFACSIKGDSGCDKVTIKSITVTPLYTQGLLDISSPAASSSDKPRWDDRGGDMTVTLGEEDMASNPYEIAVNNSTVDTDPVYMLGTDKGLLIIPREYTSVDKMHITIRYSIDTDPEVLEAKASIVQKFEGNTSYTLKLLLEPSTKGMEITTVWSAFTPWIPGDEGSHTVYNW